MLAHAQYCTSASRNVLRKDCKPLAYSIPVATPFLAVRPIRSPTVTRCLPTVRAGRSVQLRSKPQWLPVIYTWPANLPALCFRTRSQTALCCQSHCFSGLLSHETQITMASIKNTYINGPSTFFYNCLPNWSSVFPLYLFFTAIFIRS